MHNQLVGMVRTINVGVQVNELAFTRDGKLFMQATSSGVEVPSPLPFSILGCFGRQHCLRNPCRTIQHLCMSALSSMEGLVVQASYCSDCFASYHRVVQ